MVFLVYKFSSLANKSKGKKMHKFTKYHTNSHLISQKLYSCYRSVTHAEMNEQCVKSMSMTKGVEECGDTNT